MKLTFYTPSYQNTDGFGAASFGFADAFDETRPQARTYPDDINGIALCGTYHDILEAIPEGNWQAGVVLLGNAGGENEFVRSLVEKTGIPLVGGSGAIHPLTGESALITGRGQAAVFLINDDRYEIMTACENVHYDILSKHKLSVSGRYIETIDGQDAVLWYKQKREQLGLSEKDFEHLTLADEKGINAHLSIKDGKLFSGRDPAEVMELRYLPKDKAQERIQKFYDDKDAIIFGCAGLKQTLSGNIRSGDLGLFMFGEVCTIDDHSDFGNLMLSKLIIRKK